MTSLPQITDGVNKSANQALAAIGKGEYDRALLFADLLEGAGFQKAAGRIKQTVAEKQEGANEPDMPF